ncbi:MAG: YdbH domain-containing protein [Victivallaceae bacterium]
MEKNKKKMRRLGCLTLSLSHILAIGFTIAVMLAYWYIPAWLGGKLLPRLAALAGINGISAQVRELGFTGAEFEKVQLKLDGSRVVSADSIRVGYQLPLWPFRHGIKINALEISGARIRVIREGKVWIIPGIYPELFKQKPVAGAGTPVPKSPNPSPDKIDLKNFTLKRCVLLAQIGKERLEFPFSVRMNNQDVNDRKITASCKLQCEGDVLRAKVQWYPKSGRFELKFNGEFNFENYLLLLPPGAAKIDADTAFAGDFFGDMDLSGIKKFAGTMNFSGLHVNFSGMKLENQSKDTTAVIMVKGSSSGVEYSLSGFNLSGPLTLPLDKISGSCSWNRETVKGQGNIISRVDANNKQLLKLKSDLPFVQRYDFNWNRLAQQGRWTYSADLLPPVGSKSVEAGIGTGRLRFKALKFDGSGGIDLKHDLMTAKMSAGVASAIGWQAGKMEAEVNMPVAGITLEKTNNLWRGNVNFDAESLKMASLQLKTGKLKVDLPLRLNVAVPGRDGVIQWQRISIQDKPLLDIDLAVKNTESGYAVDGKLKPLIFPDAVLDCQGGLQMRPVMLGNVALHLEKYTLPEAFSLEQYFPKLTGMSFGGIIEGGCEYKFSPAGGVGKASFSIAEGKFNSAPMNLTVEGINGKIVFPGLPELRTMPLQILNCKSLRAGTVNIADLNAEYQIEPGNALLLENFSANWCGGRIYTQALRIAPGQKNLKAVIYCDGIILSRLIGEAGIAQAVGDGTVQGRLPVNIGPEGIILEPGYLYSEPGDEHNLRVKGMEKMLDGLPADSAQFSQMDIATEALKDFDYEWVKINFSTIGDALRLEMQLNGRPAKPLPFKYDSQRGGFLRVKGESVKFQGIRLNINTNIPLNRMLKFNENVKKLFGGKKP